MEETSLLHDLTVREHVDSRIPCAFQRLQSSMTQVESEALDNALALAMSDHGVGRAKVYSYEWLAGVLQKHSYQISPSTIGRHARKQCGCDGLSK